MKDEEIRRYLMQRSRRATQPGMPQAGYGASQDSAQPDQSSYRDFYASELYCPKCKRAVPSREKHLLYLPNGDLYDYSCPNCGTSLGSRRTG